MEWTTERRYRLYQDWTQEEIQNIKENMAQSGKGDGSSFHHEHFLYKIGTSYHQTAWQNQNRHRDYLMEYQAKL